MKVEDKVKTYAIALVLSTTISDAIQGLSKDILAPIFNYILPGSYDKPLKIGSIKLYITRFALRIINLIIGVTAVYYLTQKVSKQQHVQYV